MTDTPTAELAELEATLRDAQTRERELAEQQRTANLRAQALEAELVALTESDPAQFDPDGIPKAKSEAAKLAASVQTLRSPAVAWSSRQEIAKDQTRKAGIALHAFVGAEHRALADDLVPEARASVAALESALHSLIEACNRVTAIDQQFTRLLISVQGLDGSDLTSTDPVAAIARFANQALDKGVSAPLPRSLYPENDNPPRILNADCSGYIGLENASDEELAAAGLGPVMA